MTKATLFWFVVLLLNVAGSSLRGQEAVEVEARAALDEYIAAWNAADNEAIAAVSNFPRLSIGIAGQVVVRQAAEELEIDFDLLRQAEGWDHTTLDFV